VIQPTSAGRSKDSLVSALGSHSWRSARRCFLQSLSVAIAYPWTGLTQGATNQVLTESAKLPALRMQSVRRIHHNGEHNAFTDLCRFRGKFYLTFRSCPDGHMVHPTSAILVLSSEDGIQWKEVHRFSVPQRDVRDPHFLLFKDRLFVITGTWYTGNSTLPLDQYDLNKHLGYTVWTDDGEAWNGPQMMEGTFGHYVWRAASDGKLAYLCGRRNPRFEITARGEGDKVESVMLASEDGLVWRKQALFQEIEGDETAFWIDLQGTLTGVGRRSRNRPAQLLRSQPPYLHWDRVELERGIGGPMIVRWGDHWLIGGRDTSNPSHPVTALDWLDGDRLVRALQLPSGGDNSYPGFVELDENNALLSYYSTHEEDRQGRPMTAIYLAQLTKE
jgi:hypothetical protein